MRQDDCFSVLPLWTSLSPLSTDSRLHYSCFCRCGCIYILHILSGIPFAVSYNGQSLILGGSFHLMDQLLKSLL